MSNRIAHFAYGEGKRLQVGYSASSRSSCKQCRAGISKDALRVAQLVASPADGVGPKWCHPECFLEFIRGKFAKSADWFSKYVPEDPTKIPGFASLTDTDKEQITDLVDQGKHPRQYVVTITRSQTPSGKMQLLCTNMAGDVVHSFSKPEALTNVRRQVARHLGRREEETMLVNPDGTLFEGTSTARSTKRKAAEMAAAGGA